MQWLRVKSDYVVLIGEYPFHKQLKEEIVPILEQYPDIQEKKTNVKATMTEWDWNPGSDRIERLKQCINTEVYNYCQYNFVTQSQPMLFFKDFWGNVYRKGDYTRPHDHVGSVFSIVYFLKTKWYDSPLVFTHSKKRIRPREGTYVMFPSHLQHHVPKSRFEESRMTLSGNLNFIEGE